MTHTAGSRGWLSVLQKLAMHAFAIVVCLLCIVPLILVIAVSLSSNSDIVQYGYSLIPRSINLIAYQYIFADMSQLARSYGVTLFVSLTGTVASLWLTTSLAYVLTRKDFKLSKSLSFFVFFPMLINAGLIPWYILIVNYLHLKNTLFVLILPYLVVPWHVLLMKGFLQSFPFEIIEASRIDGANEFQTFLRIVIPTSTAGIATVALFNILMFWNDWWLSMLYMDNAKYVSLQYLLVRIMNNVEYLASASAEHMIHIDRSNLPTLTMRMAMCVLAAGPMLVVFPFFQRFFVKGIMVGSVKG